jgi:hypothetical protein
MGKWLVGIITAVITSVLVYWLTEGINSNVRQRLTPEPAHSNSTTPRSNSRLDDDDNNRPLRRTSHSRIVSDDDDEPSPRFTPQYREMGAWCDTGGGSCRLFTPAPIGGYCTCVNSYTYMSFPGVVR